jgi:hypothetical protein
LQLFREPNAGIVSTDGRRASTGVDRWLARCGPLLAISVVFLALLSRLVEIVWRYSVNIFFSDHWAIEDAILFQHHSWLEIFRWQYGLHRQGIGGIVLAIFEPLTGWNERATALLAIGILASACAVALVLKHRLFGTVTYLDVTIPLLFLTPTQYETLIGSLNPAYAPLPTLLVLLFCIAWTLNDERLRRPALLTTNFFSIYTGYGLFLGLLTPLLFGAELIRTRKRIALISLLISVASLASFFIGYRRLGGGVCEARTSNGGDYAAFVILLFSRFAQIPPSLPVASLFLALAAVSFLGATVFGFMAKFDISSSPKIVICTLTLFSTLFVGAATYGRSCSGAGFESRYMSYLILAFFGMYLGSLMPRGRATGMTVLLVAIALLSSAFVGPHLGQSTTRLSNLQMAWRDCYISTRDIAACDATTGSFIYNQPEPPDLQPKLDELERNRLNLFAPDQP